MILIVCNYYNTSVISDNNNLGYFLVVPLTLFILISGDTLLRRPYRNASSSA